MFVRFQVSCCEGPDTLAVMKQNLWAVLKGSIQHDLMELLDRDLMHSWLLADRDRNYRYGLSQVVRINSVPNSASFAGHTIAEVLLDFGELHFVCSEHILGPSLVEDHPFDSVHAVREQLVESDSDTLVLAILGFGLCLFYHHKELPVVQF